MGYKNRNSGQKLFYTRFVIKLISSTFLVSIPGMSEMGYGAFKITLPNIARFNTGLMEKTVVF